MIRIALITTWFPPVKGVAVNRMISFANYLSENSNFHVDVFSIGVINQEIRLKENLINYQSKNTSLIDSFKANRGDSFLKHNLKTIARILISKISKNRYKNWIDNTLNQLEESHIINPYDIIISSYAPEEAHLIALEFIKKHPIVWIADMRDEMSNNPYISRSAKNKLRLIEKEINNFANCITSVSKPILNDFKLLCPNVPQFREIRNGINHHININKWTFPKDNILKIGYFGTFYGDIKPDVFFRTLLTLLNEIPYKIEFHFYGVHHNFWIPDEFKNKVRIFPSVDYEESIVKMSTMDANLLILPKGERKGVYSGKIFDYISAKRPILAFVDKNDVAAELILETDSGYVIDFDNKIEGSIEILKWIKDVQNHVSKCASNEQIESLHRKNQVKKLEQTILQLL